MTASDRTIIIEALYIAQRELVNTSRVLTSRNPRAYIIQRLTDTASQMADLRVKLQRIKP